MPRDIEKRGFMECLTNFIGSPEGLTEEDLLAELKEQNIDIDQLNFDVAETVRLGSEEMRLGWRKRARQRISDFKELTKSLSDKALDFKDDFGKFITNNYGPDAYNYAEAYFHHKELLSEQDILKLMEDLEQLELLDKSESNKD